jgi:Ca2+-binding RTX toxin-like protein
MQITANRARRLVLLISLVAVGAGLFPMPNAVAATALVEPSDLFGFNTLKYIADPGEANSVTISPVSTLEVQLRDTGATITPGAGCTSIDPNAVRCAFENFESGDGFIDAVLGDGDDALTLSRGVRVNQAIYRGGDGEDTLVTGGGSDSIERLLGGPGNDILRGRGGADHLDGGPGGDTLSGGTSLEFQGFRTFVPDIDSVTWARRTNDVSADPDGLADDGEAGEGDLLEDDVEWLIGGGGDDVLVGTVGLWRVQGKERLFGSKLWGRSGNDLLLGRRAGDTLRGGGGDDVLRGFRGGDVMTGGRGNDRLVGGRGRDAIRGSDGRDLLLARDGRRDQVNGGAGMDRARIDEALDHVFRVETILP